jgi:hypothetical protein
MARYIKLIRASSENVNVRYHGAFRVQVTVARAENMPAEVFLYQRLPPNADGEVFDRFLTVCSPVDLAEYPTVEPDDDLRFPYFRKDSVELDFRSTDHAQEFWEIMMREVCCLREALDRLDALEVTAEFECGELDSETTDSEESETSEESADSETP